MKLRVTKQTFQIFFMINVILLLFWYIQYQNMPIPLPLESFTTVFSYYSMFTNIALLLSVYTLFYLLLLNSTLPRMRAEALTRGPRGSYMRTNLKNIIVWSFLFSFWLNILTILLALLQLTDFRTLVATGCFTGCILNTIHWTLCYAVLGCIYIISLTITCRYWMSMTLTVLFSIFILWILRFYKIKFLFSEIDVYGAIYEMDSLGLNILLYALTLGKLLLLVFLLYSASCVLFKKKDILKEIN